MSCIKTSLLTSEERIPSHVLGSLPGISPESSCINLFPKFVRLSPDEFPQVSDAQSGSVSQTNSQQHQTFSSLSYTFESGLTWSGCMALDEAREISPASPYPLPWGSYLDQFAAADSSSASLSSEDQVVPDPRGYTSPDTDSDSELIMETKHTHLHTSPSYVTHLSALGERTSSSMALSDRDLAGGDYTHSLPELHHPGFVHLPIHHTSSSPSGLPLPTPPPNSPTSWSSSLREDFISMQERVRSLWPSDRPKEETKRVHWCLPNNDPAGWSGWESSEDLITPPRDTPTEIWSAVSGFFVSVRDGVVALMTKILSAVTHIIGDLASSLVNVVTSLLGLITSATVLAIESMGGLATALLAVSLSASLTTFVANLATLIARSGASWNSDRARVVATRCIPELVDKATQYGESLLVHPNADDPAQTPANPPDYLAQVPAYVQNVKKNLSQMSPRDWINSIINIIVTVLFAGLGASGACNVNDIKSVGQVVKATTDTGATLSNVADFVATKIVGIDMDHDLPKCEALERVAKEGADLCQKEPVEYVRNGQLLVRLNKYLDEVIKVTSQPISPKSSRRYQTVRTLIVNLYRQLTTKHETIRAILATKPRQCTVGVVLSGPEGVGKSTLGKELCKRVAQQLGYSPAIYTLNHRQDGFYEAYGGQDFGEYNEWMALRSEDPILKDLNGICSTDPMNFEAAALDGKHQPCRLKLVFLTSNMDNPELSRVLNEGAVKAMWDRLYHVRIDDPLCKGRHFPNTHRKADFSHLRVRRVLHNRTSITYQPFSLPSLVQRLVGRVASAESAFVHSLLEQPPVSPDPMVATTNASMVPKLRERLAILDSLVMANPPYDDVPAPTEVTPNALSREFFVIRMQGVPGSGKSTSAERVARELGTVLKYPIACSTMQTAFAVDDTVPRIYVLDDWVESGNFQEFLEKMNSTHRLSIFIITSNTVFPRYSSWSPTYFAMKWTRALAKWNGMHIAPPPYVVPSRLSNVPPGILRRIGLPGEVMLPDGAIIDCPKHWSDCFTFHEYFIIRDCYGNVTTTSHITEKVFARYKNFLEAPSEFTILDTRPPYIQRPMATVSVNSPQDIMRAMNSEHGVMAAYMGSNPKVILEVDLVQAFSSQVSSTIASAWTITEEPTDDPIVMRSVFSRMCGSFQRIAPQQSFLVRIESIQTTYYYYKGVGYIYKTEETNSPSPIKFCNDHVDIKRPDRVIQVTLREFVAWRLFNQFSGGIALLTMEELRMLSREYDTQSAIPGKLPSFATRVKLTECEMSRQRSKAWLVAEANLRKNPIFWLGCGFLAAFCIGTGVYGVYQLSHMLLDWYRVRGQKSAPPADNNGAVNSSPEMEGKKDTKARRTAFARSGQEYRPRRNDARAEALKNALTRAVPGTVIDDLTCELLTDYFQASSNEPDLVWDEFVDRILSDKENPYFAMQDMMNEGTATREHFSKHPLLGRIHANMLSANDMIEQRATVVDEAHRILTKFYYGITNTKQCKCFAIALKDRLLLTVGHMFANEGEKCTVSSEGTLYEAMCIKVFRDRDLAVVRVTDPKFKSAPNTRRYFIPPDDIDSATYGWYLRPGPDVQVMGGRVTYYDTVAYPLTCRDPLYDPKEKFVVWTAVGCEVMRGFIKRGDCGFPLIHINHDFSFKIMALHNAYNEREKAYFSAVTTTDWDTYVQCAITPNGASLTEENSDLDTVSLHGVEMLMPAPFAEALEELAIDVKYGHYGNALDIWGYSNRLNFRSRPRNKHHLLERPYLKSPVMTLPSAVDLSWVTDTTGLAMDALGTPHPLFTQCLKYDKRIQCSYDPIILKHAIDCVAEYSLALYGPCRQLRLHEVVNGVYHEPLASLDPATSAGPYMKLRYGIVNKVPLLKRVDPGTILIDMDHEPGTVLRAQYDHYMYGLMVQGKPPCILSKDCAKVEMLPAEKAAAGKVRLFNEMDLAVNMLQRSLFGDLVGKIMLRHNEAPIRLGLDPYTDSTEIFKQFARISGTLISTDFSAFDKQLPSVLIYAFCEIARRHFKSTRYTQEQVDRAFAGMAFSLTYVIHTCEGTIYAVDRGNESGSFVTTALNSYAVWIITYYSCCKVWRDVFGRFPTWQELARETCLAILGDDRAFKSSMCLPVQVGDFMDDARLFGLKCTPAKTDSGLDFCSRSFIWDDVNQVCWPALKKTSILGQVRWYVSLSATQVIENLSNALYEAALHPDPALYNLVRHDADAIISEYGIDPALCSFHSYEHIRSLFIEKIRPGCGISAPLPTPANEHPADYIEKHKRSYTKRFEKPEELSITDTSTRDDFKRVFQLLDFLAIMADPVANPKGAVYELLQSKRIAERPQEAFFDLRPSHSDPPSFKIVVKFGELVCEAVAPSKKEASRNAYLQLFNLMRDISSDLPNCDDIGAAAAEAAEAYGKKFMYRCILEHLSIATRIAGQLKCPVVVLISKRTIPPLEDSSVGGFRCKKDADGNLYILSATAQYFAYNPMRCIYLMQPGTTDVGEKVLVGVQDTTPNMDQPVSNSAVDGVQNNPGMGTLPQLPNPITTAVLPAAATNEPAAVGALEPMIPHEDLNPTGAPNMLSVGAIGFDIKDLVYSQYIDSDTQYTYTDDSPQGTIIFQIPYDPTSEYVNPYIRQYVSQHERYAGSLLFRITIVGNATYSGIIGMAWQPKKIAGTVAKISELHKYSYYGENVTLPSNKVMVLHDARKQYFYREVADSDKDNRPHLVCYVHMTAVSPLKEGITIRIRVASKLSAGMIDGTSPFQVSLPIIPSGKTTGAGTYSSPGIDIYDNLTSLPLVPIVVRPTGLTQVPEFYLALDGRTFPSLVNAKACTDYITSKWDSGRCGSYVHGYGEEDKIRELSYTDQVFNRVAFVMTQNRAGEKGTQQMTVVDATRLETGPIWFPIKDLETFWKNKGYKDGSKFCDYIYIYLLEQINTKRNYKIYSTAVTQSVVAEGTTVTVEYDGKRPYSLAVKQGEYTQHLIYTSIGVMQVHEFRFGTLTPVEINTQYASVDIGNLGNTQTQIRSIESITAGDTMPTGWRHVAITADLPWVVTEAQVGRTLVSHQSLLAILGSISYGLTSSEVLQIELNDLDSARLVTTLWFLPDRRCLVANVLGSEYYMTLLRPLARLYIARVQRIPRTSEFPETDPSAFASNTIHPALSVARHKRIYHHDGSQVFSNAMAGVIGAIAGGNALSGIGQGISSAGQAWWQSQENQKNRDFGRQQQQDWINWLREQQNNQWANQFEWQKGHWGGLTGSSIDISNNNWEQSARYNAGLAIFDQELAGYRTPGAKFGKNRTANPEAVLPSLPGDKPRQLDDSPPSYQEIANGAKPPKIDAIEHQPLPGGMDIKTDTSLGVGAQSADQHAQDVTNWLAADKTFGKSVQDPQGQSVQPPSATTSRGRRVNPNIGGLRPSSDVSTDPVRRRRVNPNMGGLRARGFGDGGPVARLGGTRRLDMPREI